MQWVREETELADGFSGRHMNCTRRAPNILRLRENNVDGRENSRTAKMREETEKGQKKIDPTPLREC